MQSLTFKNDLHQTQCTVQLKTCRLSTSQLSRLRKTLCPDKSCNKCGLLGEHGDQGFYYELFKRSDNTFALVYARRIGHPKED